MTDVITGYINEPRDVTLVSATPTNELRFVARKDAWGNFRNILQQRWSVVEPHPADAKSWKQYTEWRDVPFEQEDTA